MNNIWQFLAGLGIFLFGMNFMEEALKLLAGRTFKLFLRKYTSHKLGAIITGVLSTVMLQSSSVVSLMALAFVGAGVMQMQNALAVIFGANLGTSLSNWLVVLLGFKFDIELIAYPLIALAGIGMIFAGNRKRYSNVLRFLLGFAFLFLGIGFMKTAMGNMVAGFDFSPYVSYNRVMFILIGFFLTALIQSSSAAVAITLSALHAGVIPLHHAAAVVIGSELGTSMKTLLGSMGGIAAKKRVAAGNIFFNLIITVMAALLLHPILSLINAVTGGGDPLVGLVFFQNIINFMGLLLFYPFIERFSNFMEKRFSDKDRLTTEFIPSAAPQLAGASLFILEREVKYFIYRVAHLNLGAFHIQENIFNADQALAMRAQKRLQGTKSYTGRYEEIKKAEGEILAFYMKMRRENLSDEERLRMDQLMSAVRDAMYSAKELKDVKHHPGHLRASADDEKYREYLRFKKYISDFYKELNIVFGGSDVVKMSRRLEELLVQTAADHRERMKEIYLRAERGLPDKLDTSTLLNVNREVYSSCKSMIRAIKDFILPAAEPVTFTSIPPEAG